MLGEIRDYLKQRDAASLHEISVHFDISADTAKLALSYWINKGKVEIINSTCDATCNGCSGNDPFYRWKISENPVQWHPRNR